MTMHPRLSVDAMCTFRWPFERDLALWKDMGLRHAGVMRSKLGDDPAARMAELAAAGIRPSTLITDAFDLSAPDSWEQTRERQRAAIDLIAPYGPSCVYFTPGRTTGDRWSEDLDKLAEAVAPTVAYGNERGIRASIEPSVRTNVSFVNTVRDAIDVAERTGLAIVADFGNMWMERDFREVLKRGMPHISLMQIGDIAFGPTMPMPGGRVHIGEGELPIRRMLQDVLDAGYTGPFDLEVVPTDYAAETDEAALRQGLESASAMLASVGI